ncbi:MAG TPA: response regulator [Mariprofundaceae bacterium]|nr:response regulator [Mariprofundaceae bacterium]
MIHIIDDEDSIRNILKALLGRAGYDVLCFEFAEQYLEYLQSSEFQRPTIVLSDIVLPGLDGFDLALKIREKLPFQKILLMTGYEISNNRQRAANQLCYMFEKPFSTDKLIPIIDALCACENALIRKEKTEYFQQCEFGAGPACPFYHPDD